MKRNMTITQSRSQDASAGGQTENIEMPRFPHQRPVTKLNWRIIASIDIDQVMQGWTTESKVLQNVLPGIAFCSLDDEFNEQKLVSNKGAESNYCLQNGDSLPPGFAKLFRLAQLIIQYLLHSQKKLTEAIKILQNNNSGHQKAFKSLSKRIQMRNREINALKIECTQRKKLLEQQQEYINKGKDPANFSKCPYCPKIFVNGSYLMSHQFRRHPEEMNNQRIQKSENEKTHLKYPMSNNENFTKSGSNLTEDGFDNVKDSDNICNERTLNRNSKDEIVTDTNVLEILKDFKADIQTIAKRSDTHSQTKVTDDIAANSSDMIQPNTSSIPVSVVEEIRYIVKRQELELEDLRNRLDNVTTENDDNRYKEAAKLEAQELYWKAQMKSQEQDHTIQIQNVMTELAKLKDVTDICKESALKECTKEMNNSNDETDISTKNNVKDNYRIEWRNNADLQSPPIEMEKNPSYIQHKREEGTVVNENLNGPFKNKGIMFVGNTDPNSGMTALSNQHVLNNIKRGGNEHENDACISNKERVDINRIGKGKGDDDDVLDAPNVFSKTLSKSMKDLHEYASIQSLLETFDNCQGDDDVLDNNTSFLAPYRKKVMEDMQFRLEELDSSVYKESNKDNDAELGISEHCLQMSMASLKRKRKNQSNAKALHNIRKQCRDEVDGLISQANFDMLQPKENESRKQPRNKVLEKTRSGGSYTLGSNQFEDEGEDNVTKSGSINITSVSFGQRMSSVRKRLVKSWRRNRKSQIRRMHDNRTIMDEDIQVSKFPYLEGHRKGFGMVERPERKVVSSKEMLEISETVEIVFPHTAPTPPSRQKISKLTRRNNGSPISDGNSYPKISRADGEVQKFIDEDNEGIPSTSVKKNINSNIYVESPIKRKPEVSTERDLHERDKPDTIISSSLENTEKNCPVPAPRASVLKNMMEASNDTKGVDSEHALDFEIVGQSKGSPKHHLEKISSIEIHNQSLECERTVEEFRYSPSIDTKSNESFDVSVDIHHKPYKHGTVVNTSDTDDNESDPEIQNARMTVEKFQNVDTPTNESEIFSLHHSHDDDVGDYSVDDNEDTRELYSPILASEIKLKTPTPGSKIETLGKQIQQQMEEQRIKREALERDITEEDGEALGIDQIKHYPLKDISDTELEEASTLKPFQINDGELSGRAGASSWDSDRD